MVTGLVEPKLSVGIYCAPAGVPEICADRLTLPVKPPAGVTVTVAVLLVVAPGAEMVTLLALRAMDGGIAVTVTEAVPVDALKLLSPE
jgi:hypothetical protein